MSRESDESFNRQIYEIDLSGAIYSTVPIEIEGVISPRRQHSVLHGREYLVHSFQFSAWRTIEGPLHRRPLLILRKVQNDDMESSLFPALTIHRLRVLLSPGRSRAVFLSESEDNANVHQLAGVAEVLSQPTEATLHAIGRLTLDRTDGWYKGHAIWNGYPTIVHLQTDDNDEEEFQSASDTVSHLWEKQQQWLSRVEDFGLEKLCKLKNNNWLSRDEQPIEISTIKRRIIPQSMYVRTDGCFELYFDDSGLFRGERIVVVGSIELGIRSIGLEVTGNFE